MSFTRKPGKSGAGENGNPPPYSDHQKKIHDFATTTRVVRSGGQTESLTNQEIMLRKQFESGVAGSPVAQRDFLRQAEDSALARRAHIDAECARWSAIKASHFNALERARATGSPIRHILPHPDDIVIDWANGVRFLGPCRESDVKRFDESVRLRDALLMQQAMEDAVDRVPARDRPSLGGAWILAVAVNDLLPPSLRLSDHLFGDQAARLSRLSQREALLQCLAAWRTAGARLPRGWRLGTLDAVASMLQAIGDLVRAFQRVDVDPEGFEDAFYATHQAFKLVRRSAQNSTGPQNRKPQVTEARP